MQTSTVLMEDEIESRVRLYDFSTGKQTFFQWQAGMVPALSNARVLELGCGSGALWRSLLPRWPACQLTMTDIADEVLVSTRVTLEPLSDYAKSIDYQTVDFNNLPFADASFDVVIANHNLYYASDVSAVLQSIQRILTPGGRLICSTIGRDHLIELVTMLRKEEQDLPWGAERWAENFGLENGVDLLLPYFPHIDHYEYDNRLHVNAIEPVFNYLLKTMKGALSDWVQQNQATIKENLGHAMKKRGYIRLTPHSGFFVATKDAE